jgi:hypothetical protein
VLFRSNFFIQLSGLDLLDIALLQTTQFKH